MLSKFARDTFSMKLFKIFASSAVVISVIITAIFTITQSRIAEDSLIKEGKMLAHILSRTARAGIFSESRELLEESVRGISDENHITGIWLYSDMGKELFALGKGALTGRPGKKDNGLLVSPETKLIDVIREKNTFAFQSPVYMESYGDSLDMFYSGEGYEEHRDQRLIGYVKIQMDTAHLQTAMIHTLFKDGVALLLFLLAGFIFIYFTAEKASRPLVKLTETVRSFGKGKPFEKVPVETDDEIGRLAGAFNEMSDSLKKKEEDVLAYEEKLNQAKKMEAVGTLAKGISHDFKNILTTIEGAMFVIDKQLYNKETVLMSTKIHSAVDKSRELIQGLVAFSSTQRITPDRVDIVKLIRSSETMLRNILGMSIPMNIHLPEQPLVIMADRIQIERVLMNLCANAADAMTEGGLLTITVGESEIPLFLQSKLPEREGLQEQQETEGTSRYAEITVEDTGTGMDNNTIGKIFEPFFTTKASGKGTGLGLAIVFGIIEQHEGHIEVESEVGKGTVFRIYLPLVRDNEIPQ